jgi:hypothetical protein
MWRGSKVGECVVWIDELAPQLALLLNIAGPKRLQRSGVGKMRPQLAVEQDAYERAAHNIFHHLQFLNQIEPCVAVKHLKVLVLVQMFHVAAHVIGIAHQRVMAWADEQLRPALELLSGFPLFRHDQPIDAAAVLMQPVHVVADHTCFEIQVENPEQSPTAALQRRSFNRGDLLRQLSGQLKINQRDRRIGVRHAGNGPS